MIRSGLTEGGERLHERQAEVLQTKMKIRRLPRDGVGVDLKAGEDGRATR